MSYHCPKCKGVIYNRRNKQCGFCGTELPAELLFTAAEIAVLDKDEAAAEELHRQKQAKEDEKEKERRARASSEIIDLNSFS